jgi:cysteine desulfurase/selenocysteine lyase
VSDASATGALHPDVERIRADFPLLTRPVRGKPPIYLDNACTTLRPEPVVRAIEAHVRFGTACHGRSNHRFGRDATAVLARARDGARRLLGAERPEEVVFVRSATEGLNLVAASLGLARGDVVLTSDLEHNSNLLPWQRLASTRGVRHEVFPLAPEADEPFDLGAFRERLRRGGVKLVALLHVSNVLGIELPVAAVCREAHRHGALVLVDGAQAVLTRRVDVRALDADFYVFSLHKMMGPTGIGVLWGRTALLEAFPPFHVGGDTVTDVTFAGCTWAPLPSRLEAGVANVDGAAGAAAAFEYRNGLGPERSHDHVVALNRLATEGLTRLPRVRLLGPADPARRGAVLNFHVDGVDSKALARVLDERANVMVRAGKHCAHAWYNATGRPESVRASFAVYNTPAEVAALVRTVANVVGLLE